MKDELRKLAHFALWLGVGMVLFSLVSCASIAHGLGVATDADLATTTKLIHATGDAFGPWGSLIATGISAALIGVNHAYRNSTRKKALKAVQPGTPTARP